MEGTDMKTGIVMIVVLLLAGCSSWNTMQSAASIQGAKVADEELETAEWGVCMAPTVGAWQRRYGNAPTKAEGWAKLCSKPAITPPVQP
jgi:uncharacterized protein YceK